MTTALFNFRDAGGQRTPDGHIRPGALLRSNMPTDLTAADRERLTTIGCALDLRQPEQIEKDPVDLGKPTLEYPLIGPLGPRPEEKSVATFLQGTIEHRADRVAEAVRQVANAPDGPVLVYCVSGKDRTGLLIAVILSVLGVDDKDVAADFHRSEGVFPQAHIDHVIDMSVAAFGMTREEAVAGMTASEAAIIDALDWIRHKHGSVAGYLVRHGVTDEDFDRLHERLVGP